MLRAFLLDLLPGLWPEAGWPVAGVLASGPLVPGGASRFLMCKEYATLITGLLEVRAKVTWMTESWYSLEVKRSAADNF
jgi:hypothetical protein